MKREWRVVPQKDVVEPKNGIHMVYVDQYWFMDEHSNLVFYGDAAQTNPHEKIMQALLPRWKATEGCPIVGYAKVPTVFVSVNPSDYC